MKLHDYFRSGASYRVRIALNIKGIRADRVFHHLRKGEHRALSYVAINPQGLLPSLELDDGTIITQSLAIIEWLDETCPAPPLLPGGSALRAKVRAFSLAIAADTHPVQNLRVLERLRSMGQDDAGVNRWAAWVNATALEACEALIARESGPFCFGSEVTLADICLVPQLASARRFGVDLTNFTRLLQAEAAAKALRPFIVAAPENQPDADPV